MSNQFRRTMKKHGIVIPGQLEKAPKYRNFKTIRDGLQFDSKAEADRWRHLNYELLAGRIQSLQRQVEFVLAPRAEFSNSRASPAIKYKADFVYLRDDRLIVEDVKSPASAKLAAYRLKRHLMRTVHGIEITEVM